MGRSTRKEEMETAGDSCVVVDPYIWKVLQSDSIHLVADRVTARRGAY